MEYHKKNSKKAKEHTEDVISIDSLENIYIKI